MTSLGPSFYRHAETIYEVFSHFNVNTHEGPAALHQANLIHRKDYITTTGITDDEWERNRDSCWLQSGWSATMTPKGAYFCEQAGAIDMLYFDGASAWPLEHGWWQREPGDFKDQLHLCNYCSLAQPGPSSVDQDERDIISPHTLKELERIGSPAVKKGRIELYDSEKHTEKRVITTKDNYVSPDGRRVADEHKSVRPRKVSAIVTCVGRGEQLRQTLAHNAGQVDELIVVTTPRNKELATMMTEREGPDQMGGFVWKFDTKKLRLVTSSRCFDDGHAFNKGRMLNDGLKALAPDADWVVLTDADVFLPDNLREYVRTHALNPGVLYGAKRDNGTPGLAAVNDAPNGYFQLFNRRALAIRDRWPAVMSEEFCSAGGIDTWFMQQFPPGKRYVIPELSVRHLEHGDGLGAGWNGTADGPRWRQVGMFTAHAGLIPVAGAVLNAASRFRLVDTLRGEVWEGEIPESGQLPGDVLMRHEGGLAFKGKDIGTAHVHVAMWG